MRTVILADPLDNQQAGIHVYTRNLVSQLSESDKDGEVFILRRKKDGIFPAERQIILKNYRFPGYAAWRMFVLIPWKLRRLKADIVVEPAHFGPFNLPRRIKRVTVIHDLTPILFPRFHRFHSQFLQRIFLKGILKRASLILTNSDHTTRDLVHYYPGAKDKCKRIYLGRDENIRFSEENQPPLHHTEGKPYFLFTGTLEPRKNLKTLLKAYRIFREKSKTKHLLLLAGGLGWKNKDLLQQLIEHPYKRDIVRCGYVPRENLSALYQHAEAFIFPSLYEGFGLPVVEALSCGTPCLLSKSSSIPEVGGNAALYFDPASPEEIAGHMMKILEDDRLKNELRKKALEQAKKFSWEDHIRNFDQSLRKLLDQ